MKLAAVDIGSNAIRLQITTVTSFQGTYGLKKLEYLRFPLRLGKDVFLHQAISEASRRKFVRLMGVFKELMELYEVDHYMVCATSAMRESVNGVEIAKEVAETVGLHIEIIDGEREAELIDKALWSSIDAKTYLHIDVGGGSTELNIYKRSKKIGSRSFKIGSVRTLDEEHVPLSIWREMEEFIASNLNRESSVTCIGTGGNINKIMELSNPRKNKRYLDKHTIKLVQERLISYSYEERMHILNLNADRADVIVPASKIYLAAMDAARSSRMIVPDVGLKDGLMNLLFEKVLQERGLANQ
ncbi:Exopolyphosphatase [Lunatimonas lonarensis]|uniref:Exopolyphosphatase n=1 Tax=Lunatimonas lonarensis TaxID=1232681 RepID=R7ZY79_9BACT|nr:exopolyphosphatase [Lunatimonas lonarensis]EON78993.1 Exopolyphosphatase [Lunatimonas lonarensis]